MPQWVRLSEVLGRTVEELPGLTAQVRLKGEVK
jgi:hypothetical protein